MCVLLVVCGDLLSWGLFFLGEYFFRRVAGTNNNNRSNALHLIAWVNNIHLESNNYNKKVRQEMDPPEAVGLSRPSGRSSRKTAPPPFPRPKRRCCGEELSSYSHRTKTTTVLAFCALVILLIFQYYQSSTNLSPIMHNINNATGPKHALFRRHLTQDGLPR